MDGTDIDPPRALIDGGPASYDERLDLIYIFRSAHWLAQNFCVTDRTVKFFT